MRSVPGALATGSQHFTRTEVARMRPSRYPLLVQTSPTDRQVSRNQTRITWRRPLTLQARALDNSSPSIPTPMLQKTLTRVASVAYCPTDIREINRLVWRASARAPTSPAKVLWQSYHFRLNQPGLFDGFYSLARRQKGSKPGNAKRPIISTHARRSSLRRT